MYGLGRSKLPTLLALGLVVGYPSVFLATNEPSPICREHGPTEPSSHFQQGLASYRLGKYPNAVNELSIALQECPADEWVMYYLARAHLEEKDFQRSEELGRMLINHTPKFSRGYFVLGYSFFETHQWPMAIEQLQAAIRLEPEFWESHLLLGSTLVVLNRKTEGEAEFREAVKLNPESPDAHYYLGRLYFTRNRFPEALVEFSRMLELDPNSIKAYNNLGATHDAMGLFDIAASDFNRAIQLGKESGVPSEWPYINLGKLNYDGGNPDAARPFFLEAIRINPRNDVGYFWLGKVQFAAGELEGAEKSLEKAISIYEESPNYYYFLAKIYQKLGKKDSARISLTRFLELQKKD